MIRGRWLAALGFLAVLSVPAHADDVLARGQALLEKNCGSCHATGRSDSSRQSGAPAFRTLGQRYPVDSLEEALAEGLMVGHPAMPEFSFDADEVGAIIDYLKSIQQR
jgi:mono/diheme cytochrome c family protein